MCAAIVMDLELPEHGLLKSEVHWNSRNGAVRRCVHKSVRRALSYWLDLDSSEEAVCVIIIGGEMKRLLIVAL